MSKAMLEVLMKGLLITEVICTGTPLNSSKFNRWKVAGTKLLNQLLSMVLLCKYIAESAH